MQTEPQAMLPEPFHEAPRSRQCASREVVTRKSTLIVLVSVATFLSASACGSRSSATQVAPIRQTVVSDVVDGDTIVVRFPSGTEEIIRLLGIDTPETVDPNRPIQCYGAEASAHVSTVLAPGTAIRVERDVEARDHFGRLLAYVFRSDDDLFVNLDLARRGFADLSIYPPNNAYAAELGAATTSARTGAIGLWGECGGPDVALDPPGPHGGE